MSEPCNWWECPAQPKSKPEPEAANTISWSKDASNWELKATPYCSVRVMGAASWWRPRAFSHLSQEVAPWIAESLKSWVDLLRALDQKIQGAKVALAQRYQGPRPKGVGALSLAQLSAEVLDWNLYSNGRKIACLAGMVPSEWSTGDSQRLGAITKVGLPAIRRIITEAVWPHYPLSAPVQAGAKVATSLERHQPGAQEKGHRGHRPTVDG